MRSTRALFGIAVLACIPCTGCSVWEKDKATTQEKSWSLTKMWEKEYQAPASIAAIWSPEVLTLPGKVPTRGFGGRVYLYNEKSQAIPVDGELIVHGYAKKGRRGGEQVKADKTFGFTAEQLTSHFSPSELGASYSIWIPWDEAGGIRKEITLIPTFKDKKGRIVQGAPPNCFYLGCPQSPPTRASSECQFQHSRSPIARAARRPIRA